MHTTTLRLDCTFYRSTQRPIAVDLSASFVYPGASVELFLWEKQQTVNGFSVVDWQHVYGTTLMRETDICSIAFYRRGILSSLACVLLLDMPLLLGDMPLSIYTHFNGREERFLEEVETAQFPSLTREEVIGENGKILPWARLKERFPALIDAQIRGVVRSLYLRGYYLSERERLSHATF